MLPTFGDTSQSIYDLGVNLVKITNKRRLSAQLNMIQHSRVYEIMTEIKKWIIRTTIKVVVPIEGGEWARGGGWQKLRWKNKNSF